MMQMELIRGDGGRHGEGDHGQHGEVCVLQKDKSSKSFTQTKC